MRITSTDLRWWLELASQLDWTFARTYADSAPHSYVVLGRTLGMAREDYVRAGRVIHTYGRPAKFYGMTSIYLTDPDGRLKWWTMDADVTETTLVNQATTDRLYGVQNAPSTESGVETLYDETATSYDVVRPTDPALVRAIREAVTMLSGDYPPSVLDVGCGTGRVLDLGVTPPDRYAGVDPSKPMLNQLVRKYPNVGAIYPTRVEKTIADGRFTAGQFEIVTALLSDADEIGEETIRALRRIASRGFVMTRADALTVVNTHQAAAV